MFSRGCVKHIPNMPSFLSPVSGAPIVCHLSPSPLFGPSQVISGAGAVPGQLLHNVQVYARVRPDSPIYECR